MSGNVRNTSNSVMFSMVALCLAGTGVIATEATTETELQCTTAGYDILIVNTTDAALEEGVGVEWEVRFVRKSGAFNTDRVIEPGQDILVSGALGSDYLSAPQPCTALVKRDD